MPSEVEKAQGSARSRPRQRNRREAGLAFIASRAERKREPSPGPPPVASVVQGVRYGYSVLSSKFGRVSAFGSPLLAIMFVLGREKPIMVSVSQNPSAKPLFIRGNA